jgi:hypothetical protein
MKKYLHLPTHQKFGWLVFVGGFFVTGLTSIIIPQIPTLIYGAIQVAFFMAFVIEIIASVIGKNKSTN